MGPWLAAYAGSALTMVALDSLWLNAAAKRLYRPHLGDLLADQFRLPPAVLFYLIYVAGVLFLAVMPGLEAGKWTAAATRGAVLGLVAYGAYDLTNQATLKSWSTTVTIVDMAWGTLVTAIAATAGFTAARWAMS